MIRRFLIFVYAFGAYLFASASLFYLMGFIADVGVPKSINDGDVISTWRAVLVDVGLVGLFGLHHSITARTSFKRWWTKVIPTPIERATYLCMTTIMTMILVALWQPIPVVIWSVESNLLVGIVRATYIAIWVMMTAATFHFGYFGFFGLSQAWQYLKRKSPEPPKMTARYLYAMVRHPISLGWMIAPFFVPRFTVSHFVFAMATVAYIIVATRFEETDLIEDLGDSYRNYQKRVPRFIPFS